MASNKLFTLVLLLAVNQVCFGSYQQLLQTEFQCTSICSQNIQGISFKQYEDIIVEVELIYPNYMPADSSLLVYPIENQRLMVSPQQGLISATRAIFHLNKSIYEGSQNLVFSFIANQLSSISSTYSFKLSLFGNTSIDTLISYHCPFHCSGQKGECDTLTGKCTCNPGHFGIDCGLEGLQLEEYEGLQDYTSFQFLPNQSIIFYLTNSNGKYTKAKKHVNLKVKADSQMDLYEYGGVSEISIQKTTNLNQIWDIVKSIKYDMEEIPSDYQMIFIFTNTNSQNNELKIKFSLNNAQADLSAIDISTTYGIIILVIIVMISLVFLLLAFLTTRYIIAQYKQKKLVQFQQNQRTLQLDSKMPSQKYADVAKKYPNIREINECSVCLDDFKDENDVRLTPCFHIFHNDCFNSFAYCSKNQNKTFMCPVCRRSLQDGEKDVFDYKLKMQCSHTIEQPEVNKEKEEKSSEENKDKVDIENRKIPATAITSCNNIDEASSMNSKNVEQANNQQIVGAVCINIETIQQQQQQQQNILETQNQEAAAVNEEIQAN